MCKKREALKTQVLQTKDSVYTTHRLGLGPSESLSSMHRSHVLGVRSPRSHSLSDNEINPGWQRWVGNTPKMIMISRDGWHYDGIKWDGLHFYSLWLWILLWKGLGQTQKTVLLRTALWAVEKTEQVQNRAAVVWPHGEIKSSLGKLHEEMVYLPPRERKMSWTRFIQTDCLYSFQ